MGDINRSRRATETTRRFTPSLRGRFEAVAPSGGQRHDVSSPARVVLDDGTAVDCAFLVDAQQYISAWGVWPDQDEGKREVSISDVTQIESSPFRLPAELAMRCRRTRVWNGLHAIRNSVPQWLSQSPHFRERGHFVNLAPGKNIHDVEEVIPHAGRDTRPQLDAPDTRGACIAMNRRASNKTPAHVPLKAARARLPASGEARR